MAVTVYGVSDDLIFLDGDIRAEFRMGSNEDSEVLAFSNGVVLRVRYTAAAVWRIELVTAPAGVIVAIAEAPGDDEENYSDSAEIVDTVAWAVHGTGYVHRQPRDAAGDHWGDATT